jgi:stage V sporulation protein B
MKQSSLVRNAAILFAAMAITKLISAALKIPLTNILGGLGMGYFSTAYSLFSPVYAVTAAALPVVIMRLTAQNAASGKFRNVLRIRRAGLFAAFGLGLTGTAAVLVIAAPFSRLAANEPSSLPAMLVIAPSLLFGSVAAVYRGYYEGLSDMIPTAVSQIIEAVIKSVVGIILAFMLMPLGIAYAAAGAIAGITVAEFFGVIFLFLRTRLGKDIITPRELQYSPVPQKKREIIRTILRESAPITVAALAMNVNPFIDMLTIPAITDQFTYGSYTGIAIPIFAIATAVTAMIGKSAFSEITASWERRDIPRFTRTLRILFKGTFMVGLPISLGLAALAKPVLSLLYFSKPLEVHISTPPLIILGLGGVSLILAGTLFSIFLAIGRVDLQIKLMLLGSAVKLSLNYTLIRMEHIGVSGAALATVACYTLISFIGLILLKRLITDRIGVTRLIVQPLVFAVLCGITAHICYERAFAERPDLLRLSMSVAAGALAYLVPTMITDRRYIKYILPVRNNH